MRKRLIRSPSDFVQNTLDACAILACHKELQAASVDLRLCMAAFTLNLDRCIAIAVAALDVISGGAYTRSSGSLIRIGGIAVTHPNARRRGIFRELTRVGLEDARLKGNLYCEADWRSANLAAGRCWPNLGFKPYAYRLTRRLDPRIAWANGGY